VRLRFAATTAVGVDAIGPAGRITVDADRIVLCAGAIQSAHLLMLSGIGEEGNAAGRRRESGCGAAGWGGVAVTTRNG